MSAPLQIDELTPAVCERFRPELEHALSAMRSMVDPSLSAPGRGKSPEALISDRHGLGLDPYLPSFVLSKIKKAVRS